MPQYYGSTDPQTVASAAGIPAQTYSNFNGINSPVILSTGTQTFNSVTYTSAVTLTDSLTLTGNFLHQESPTLQVIVGTCAVPASDNVPRNGFYYLSSSSGDINNYLLQSPQRGSRVELQFCCGLTTANIAVVWACSTDNTNVIIGTASSGEINIRSCGFATRAVLFGVSTGRWVIEYQSTNGENGGGIRLLSSSCS